MKSRAVKNVVLISAAIAAGAAHAPAQTPVMPTAPPAFEFNPEDGTPGHLGELEALAVDVARRTILAHHPHVADLPMRTMEVRVRPEGDVVHTYARLQVRKYKRLGGKHRKLVPFLQPSEQLTESEVSATFIYSPGFRRLIDVSYKHDRLLPFRLHNRTADIVSMYNREFDRRDPLRMATPLVGQRIDMLSPRSHDWIWNLVQGDHGWHAFVADDQVAPGWPR